jgi:Skp family chaperone for outer membrane proteins
VKKLFTACSLLAAMGAVAWFASGVEAQPPAGGNAPAGAASQPQRSKIALINIAKVLKNFNKANAKGREIQNKRQDYVHQIQAQKTSIAEQQKLLAATADAAKKTELEQRIVAMNRGIEDMERKAQKELGQLSNDTIVAVYNDIKGVLERFALANGFELILAYPDATTPEEAASAAVAGMKLQTPAAMPFYHRQLDITDYVIDTLNKSFPVAAPAAAAPGTSNVVPTSGTNRQP